MKRYRMHKKFTLVEIMVSMGVFLVLLTLLLNFFSGTRQVWKTLRDRNETFASTRVAMDLICELLQSGVYANGISGIYINGAYNECNFITSSNRTLQDPSAVSNTQGIYAVRIYRNNDGHLRIAAAPAGVSSSSSFEHSSPKSGVDTTTSGSSDKLVIRGVSGLRFTPLGTATAGSGNRPMGVEITLHVFDREDNYVTWNTMADGDAKDNFQAAHEYVFSRVVAFDDIEELL